MKNCFANSVHNENEFVLAKGSEINLSRPPLLLGVWKSCRLSDLRKHPAVSRRTRTQDRVWNLTKINAVFCAVEKNECPVRS